MLTSRGRPKSERGARKPRSFALYDDEYAIVKEFIFKLKNQEVLQKISNIAVVKRGV
jgi:hypothetical protein